MEKIKASEVLNRFAYWAVDKDGDVRIHSRMPSIVGDSWRMEGFNPKLDNVFTIGGIDVEAVDWQNSLCEIDFSEDFAEEKLELIDDLVRHLTNRFSYTDYRGFFNAIEEFKGMIDLGNISAEGQDGTKTVSVDNTVAGESMLQGTPVFKDFDGKFRPIGDLGRIVISSTKESKSIFQQGDTVHVLSYSNQGELGISTQGIVRAIKLNSFIAVEIVNGIEEVHEEKNISFTPFSIHEAGFSQVRPIKEPKIGDWGFFYDNEIPSWFVYGKLEKTTETTLGHLRYHHEFGWAYVNFSHTPPQLAEGIPNPFKEC